VSDKPNAAQKLRIEQFLDGQFCLIVEPSSSFASSIQACLRTLGIPPTRILMARRMEDARRMIESHKPRMLITEYQIGAHFGLELVDFQDKVYKGPFKVVFIATKNSSDSAVAEAAEEQVDAFLLKPFSADDFNAKLNEVLERKTNPSPYMTAIEAAKKMLDAKQFPQAAQKFIEAKPHTPKPSLACYYAGHSFLLAGDRIKALKEFQEGLQHQALHYKCLVGAFDVLIAEKRYDEAFGYVKTIKDHYPLTPKRLSQIFVVCIMSQNFADVKQYYEKYQELETRSPELTKVVSMALFAAGKHYLEAKNVPEAVSVFDVASLSVGRNFQFMDKIISEMIKYQANKEAAQFLAKISVNDRGTTDYNRLAFKVDAVTLGKEQVVEKGRQLILTGGGSPEIYELVVRLMAEAGKITLAEGVISRALTDFPDMRAALYKILETASVSK